MASRVMTEAIAPEYQNLNIDSKTPVKPVPVLDLKPKKKKLQGRHAVVTFARMQPPTIGHARLIERMASEARLYNADPILFTSVKQDHHNPLPFLEKTRFLKRLFPNVVVSEHDGVKTPFNMLAALSLLGYDKVTIVVGEDRRTDFEKFGNYVKSTGTRGVDIVLSHYNVVSLNRDPNAAGDVGMSSTKMRQYAQDNNWNDFRAGMPTKNDALAKQIFKRLRTAMGLKA